MKSLRQAFSLLEALIATSLFAVVMAAVLQSMVATTNYVDFDTTRSDLTTAAMQCQNRVINDLANAAWFYEWDEKADRPRLDDKTKKRNVLFPKVSDSGSRLVFLKLRTSLTVDPIPSKEQYGYFSFRNKTTEPVEFSHYVDSVPTPLMVMNPKYIADPQLFVAPVWESQEKLLDFDQNQDPTNLRHYMYLVETNAVGVPCLVRKYHKGYAFDATVPDPSLWTLDATIVESVAEVQFATHLEEPTLLNENQIRIRVLLRRDPSGSSTSGMKVDHRVEIIAAMRSINQDT